MPGGSGGSRLLESGLGGRGGRASSPALDCSKPSARESPAPLPSLNILLDGEFESSAWAVESTKALPPPSPRAAISLSIFGATERILSIEAWSIPES